MPALNHAEAHTSIDVTMYGGLYPLSLTGMSSRSEVSPLPSSTAEADDCIVTHEGGGGEGGGEGGGGEGGAYGGAGIAGGAGGGG